MKTDVYVVKNHNIRKQLVLASTANTLARKHANIIPFVKHPALPGSKLTEDQ